MDPAQNICRSVSCAATASLWSATTASSAAVSTSVCACCRSAAPEAIQGAPLNVRHLPCAASEGSGLWLQVLDEAGRCYAVVLSAVTSALLPRPAPQQRLGALQASQPQGGPGVAPHLVGLPGGRRPSGPGAGAAPDAAAVGGGRQPGDAPSGEPPQDTDPHDATPSQPRAVAAALGGEGERSGDSPPEDLHAWHLVSSSGQQVIPEHRSACPPPAPARTRTHARAPQNQSIISFY